MKKEERVVRYDKDLQIEAYRFHGIMQKFPNHFHEYYVIGFIENGKRLLSCRNKEYQLHRGDLVFFNPFDNHACEQIDNHLLDYRCINISAEVMQEWTEEITGKKYLPYFTNPVSFQGEEAMELHDLHQMIMNEMPSLKKQETCYFLMEQLIKNYTTSSKLVMDYHVSKPNMEIIRTYLEEHFQEGISLDELAQVVKMNKYSLLRSFTRVFGITPYRYLQTIRINEAKKLLGEGVKALDAAMQCGFVDQSHFNRYFIEFIGLTPGQYQQMFRKETI